MKTKIIILLVLSFLFVNSSSAQKERLVILDFDSQNLKYNPEQLGNIVRMEVEKLDTFEVMDKYDVAYLAKKQNFTYKDCYGKLCLIEIGKKMKADKILTGSVELYGKSIIVTLRLLNVKTEKVEKTSVNEYLVLNDEIQLMLRLSIKKLLGVEYNILLNDRITKIAQYQNSIIAENQNRLNLNGPRLGAVYFTGQDASIMTKPKSQGGIDAFPLMFMFGYQFEIQYINQGEFQALFEIVPAITGLDQSYIMPSLTILNGLRHNVKGWEFALGPIFSVNTVATGYYDKNGEWNLSRDWKSEKQIPYEETERFDSRGEFQLQTGFVFAIGKSFKSGRLNIPVNMYVIPSKNGVKIGVTFGYNATKKAN